MIRRVLPSSDPNGGHAADAAQSNMACKIHHFQPPIKAVSWMPHHAGILARHYKSRQILERLVLMSGPTGRLCHCTQIVMAIMCSEESIFGAGRSLTFDVDCMDVVDS